MAQQALSSEADTSSRGPLSRIIRQDKMPLLVLLLGALVIATMDPYGHNDAVKAMVDLFASGFGELG